MEIKVFKNSGTLAQEILDELLALVSNKKALVISLAAGHTSLELFALMVDAAKSGKADFSQCIFIGLDEWAGLGRGDDGSCIGFMQKNLFDPLGLEEDKIIFYDGKGDLQKECERIDDYILRAGGIDFMVLGVGMNGHLGLNEPGTPFDRYSHVAALDDTTKTVGQKYFKEQTAITAGITMGMRNFDQCKRIILMVTGEHKKALLEKIAASEISVALPATYLKKLPQASLYTDIDAGA